MQANGPAV